MRLEQRPERYLRWPLLARGSAGIELWVLAWEPGAGERTLGFDLDMAADSAAERSSGELHSAILGWAPGRTPRTTDDLLLATEHAADGDWRVWIERDEGCSTVWVQRADQPRARVWSAPATAAAPAIAVTPAGGAWVAFHHNLREDNHEVDLAKWICLRFVDTSGGVYEPAEPMMDRDRDLSGEEQSFEFPALAVSAEGAVLLVGRGSHTIHRQTLSDEGWSKREALDDGSWGCRGIHIDALVVDGARALVAWRGRRGIEVLATPTPTGGAPALAAATIEPAVAPKSTVAPRARDTRTDDGRWTLFGDIQQHSAHSDGLGAAVEPYLRARHVYGDDFCALTDHESFLGKRTSPGEWALLQRTAERFNEDEEFSTLVAYEWTGKRHPGPGHKCVYLPGPGFPIVSRDDVPEGAELVRRIKSQGAITGPHHTGWTGADIAGHDPDGQPFWEICSCHGCYEHADHPLGARGDLDDQLVDVALANGLRFGFIANSDAHGLLWHHGESRKRDPFRTGLTAVQSRGRGRAAIFEALRERRCYATSGVPIVLDVNVGGAPMGAERDALRRGETVWSRVRGTAPVEQIEMVTDRGVVAAAPGGGTVAELAWEAEDPLRYLYVRVTQRDGEMAWSSPVFFGDPGC